MSFSIVQGLMWLAAMSMHRKHARMSHMFSSRSGIRGAWLTLVLFLTVLPLEECGSPDAQNFGEVSEKEKISTTELLSGWVPRRTFSATGVCTGTKDKDQEALTQSLAIHHPKGDVVLPEGDVEISFAVSSLSSFQPEWSVAVLWEHPGGAPEKFVTRVELGGDAVFRVRAKEGMHLVHAELLIDGRQTGCVAYSRFLARNKDFDLESSARALCQKGQEAYVAMVTASSFCDALLQLGHEARLRKEFIKARELLADVVWISARQDRVGDMAHHVLVYPYRESLNVKNLCHGFCVFWCTLTCSLLLFILSI